jgi:hypothetical protein
LLTTVTISSDQLELMGYSVDLLKRRLRIKALKQRIQWRMYNTFRTYTTYFGNKVRDWSGAYMQGDFYYEDPDTGEVTG